ncbi:MAG: aminopeptidase P N-terminal domain-containing protein [Alteromonadaceae bacterium]|nr:aminopeptidase P N-terminal domain-containing protein [Alteromonadaceae bacterium]
MSNLKVKSKVQEKAQSDIPSQTVLPQTLTTVDEFVARRNKFMANMPENSVALFPAAKEVTRSNDTEYAFCQNKNFFYLTGFNEADALLVLVKGPEQNKDQENGKSGTEAEQVRSVLFCHAKDPLHEIWHGRRVGPDKAQQTYGFDAVFPLDELEDLILPYLNAKSQLLFCQGVDKSCDQKIYAWIGDLRKSARQGDKAPKILVDCTDMLADMRLYKSDNELNIMRKVNHISGLAHTRAMQQCAVRNAEGLFEYQIEAEILHEFARHGARHPAYASIVAGGDNANILHYTDNFDLLNNGDLLLIDAGGELAGYAADITRTFPVNGKFNAEQSAIYQLVLDAQMLAINEIKPDNTLAHLNAIVNEFLTVGLHKLGILSGELPQLIKDKACKKYFIHGLGHWLGLDVHDVGDYHSDKQRQQHRKFEPGMVMTIEPGIYIPLSPEIGDENVDEKWLGIAVRIEDNVLVTEQGFENLTVNAPKTIAEIETLMAAAI